MEMKAVKILLATAFVLGAAGALRVFDYQWTVFELSDWKIQNENGVPILRLQTGREPLPGPRRPIQFALAETPDYEQVTVEGDIRPLGRSCMIVFAYRDGAHFDYAHLSTDTANKQPHHNGIFHVYGGERVRISSEEGPAAFPVNNRWYHVKLVHDGRTGTVNVTVDNHPVPALHAVDLSLNSGKVGIGSFDETGDFRDVKITGTPLKAD
ncbi:MAG: hypothetical protein JO150_13150 [Acidobacteriaceae bacterium]|nr:hypothetical protein [Acidobacteriaceae bacterium]